MDDAVVEELVQVYRTVGGDLGGPWSVGPIVRYGSPLILVAAADLLVRQPWMYQPRPLFAFYWAVLISLCWLGRGAAWAAIGYTLVLESWDLPLGRLVAFAVSMSAVASSTSYLRHRLFTLWRGASRALRLPVR